MYVLSSKLDLVNFQKKIPIAPILFVFFFIVFCRTEHIVETSLHHLFPAVVVAMNARSWAWSIRQDTRISSIIHRVFVLNRAH